MPTCIYTYIHIHTYTYTCIHEYIHTCTHTSLLWRGQAVSAVEVKTINRGTKRRCAMQLSNTLADITSVPWRLHRHPPRHLRDHIHSSSHVGAAMFAGCSSNVNINYSHGATLTHDTWSTVGSVDGCSEDNLVNCGRFYNCGTLTVLAISYFTWGLIKATYSSWE